MKIQTLLIIICYLIISTLSAQENNILRGKMLFLNSKKTPAVGVAISGIIKNLNAIANEVYTDDKGIFELKFAMSGVGHRVKIQIDKIDGLGKSIELVNDREVDIFYIPKNPAEEFIIIVCKKGERISVAQKYYNIIKTGYDKTIAQNKEQLNMLLAHPKINFRDRDIAKLEKDIDKLESQNDSLTIYEQAFKIASINKDDASERVLSYIQLLDEGKSILEAREVLSIKEATNELGKSITQFKAAIKELETRADASKAIFDYKDAIICYENIIFSSEKIDIDRLKMSEYYSEIASLYNEDGQYKKAINYNIKAIEIQEKVLDPKHINLAKSYNNIADCYRKENNFDRALNYQKKAIIIQENVLRPDHPILAISYNNLALVYNSLKQHNEALKYNIKALSIGEKVFDPNYYLLGDFYNNIAQSYRYIDKCDNALNYQKKVIEIQEANLTSTNPKKMAISYNNLALIYSCLKRYKEALKYHQKAVTTSSELAFELFEKHEKRYPNVDRTYIIWTMYYALQNENEKAIMNLQKAVKLGYNDIEWLKSDDSMDNLRNEKEFVEIIKKLENK